MGSYLQAELGNGHWAYICTFAPRTIARRFPQGHYVCATAPLFIVAHGSLQKKFPFPYKLFHDFYAKSPNLMIKKSSYIFFALLPSPPSRPAILLRSCANNAIAKKGREHPTQYYTDSIAELLGSSCLVTIVVKS